MGLFARNRHPLLGLLAFAALAVWTPSARAGGDDEKALHLRFRPTYEQALLEARVRGVPLFVSRHKDF